jgi:pyocin large subunit-like protein
MGYWPWRRLLTLVLAAAAIVAYWSHLPAGSERALARDPGVITTSEADRKSWGNGVGFVNEQRLEEHYRKHGAEFGNITRLDYLHQAQLLRFDRQTGAFVAFNRDGTIRTFFKPNDGERYYRRQAERGE